MGLQIALVAAAVALGAGGVRVNEVTGQVTKSVTGGGSVRLGKLAS